MGLLGCAPVVWQAQIQVAPLRRLWLYMGQGEKMSPSPKETSSLLFPHVVPALVRNGLEVYFIPVLDADQYYYTGNGGTER